MTFTPRPRARRQVPLPAGVDPARARPQSTGDLSLLAAMLVGQPTNHWIDTNIRPGNAWAVRSMVSGAKDAIQSQLTEVGGPPGEALANATVGAYDTLINSNGVAYFRNAQQIYFSGGGHGGWPGNEVYGIDLESLTWFRQTDPSPMARNVDGTWRTLDNTPISTHTYCGIVAVESLNCFYVLIGSPWPLGTFIDDLWKFDINTSQWTFLHANALNGRLGAPHAVWVESEQKIALGVPQWYRWYDPFTNTLGPVQGVSGAGKRSDLGMTIATPSGLYGFFNDPAIDFLAYSGVGTVRPTHITNNYPEWQAYERWDEVLGGKNSYLWDPVRQMVISWTGGQNSPEAGRRMHAMDFANGKLYEFVLTGTYPIGEGVGGFTKFIYLQELDAYLGLNNRAENNGWMLVKPGAMTLRAEVP
jgi:hypothetical protein